MHLILTIVTATVWAPIWAVMVFRNRDRHRVIDVDAYGNVNVQK